MERQSFVFILQRSVLKFLTLPLLVSSIAVRASVHRTNSSSKFKTCAGVSSALIAKMRRNENVSTNSLMKICTALNCYIGDIIEIVPTVRGFFAPFPGGRGIAWSPLFAAALWFRSCHSEERSNEESFLLGSQDPSTSSG